MENSYDDDQGGVSLREIQSIELQTIIDLEGFWDVIVMRRCGLG